MENKVSAFDVAEYIYGRFESTSSKLTAMKLQRLVYYSQAWFLVWHEEPLFEEKIFAWASGPVIQELYDHHQDVLYVSSHSAARPHELNEDQKESIDKVLEVYGGKTAQWLSDLSRMEEPWKQARQGIPVGIRGQREIGLASIHEYYTSLCHADAH